MFTKKIIALDMFTIHWLFLTKNNIGPFRTKPQNIKKLLYNINCNLYEIIINFIYYNYNDALRVHRFPAEYPPDAPGHLSVGRESRAEHEAFAYLLLISTYADPSSRAPRCDN